THRLLHRTTPSPAFMILSLPRIFCRGTRLALQCHQTPFTSSLNSTLNALYPPSTIPLPSLSLIPLSLSPLHLSHPSLSPPPPLSPSLSLSLSLFLSLGLAFFLYRAPSLSHTLSMFCISAVPPLSLFGFLENFPTLSILLSSSTLSSSPPLSPLLSSS